MADSAASPVNERLLADRQAALAATPGLSSVVVDAFERFVRNAPDEALVRINPVRFAEQHGFATGAVVELLLRARKLGLATMEWQYVCPGCGEIVERLASLTSATAHAFCEVCSADRDADLSDFIEITFSVAPDIRRSRFHDPWALTPDEHFFRYRFTQSAVVDDGSPLRDHLERCAAACAYVEPGATRTFALTAEPGYLWFTNGPALIVGADRTAECRSFAFAYTGTRSKGFRAAIAAGPVRIDFTNATEERYALMITSLRDHYELRMTSFLSGAQLLSNQTYADLFAAETMPPGEGLAVKRLALLFTDLRGSTALYDRIGDLRAFELVRLHFGHLRESIGRNAGALVKTIGDAVMASFVDPRDAMRAALDMRARIAAFNAEAGDELLGLKIGLHYGACLAVTLNERRDYFGQTVNIAARVQALAGADEIVGTEDVMALPAVADLTRGLRIEPIDVELRGIAERLRVHRIGDAL